MFTSGENQGSGVLPVSGFLPTSCIMTIIEALYYLNWGDTRRTNRSTHIWRRHLNYSEILGLSLRVRFIFMDHSTLSHRTWPVNKYIKSQDIQIEQCPTISVDMDVIQHRY
ncbi:hypothetical protein TNIN_62991 [Trichonephila inaurata madagascariensis]|uniref:Uncharacterized protein n=1 Tax=Trichonephila inaurata madagascariensis TaxID=2747483 RepID=A0A8X7CRA3_9ARAC|nr:hypothetical protein TNIN_62991 [Trichonephila inaurata madagascariensis]